ncbi:hypothetical protein L7F22_010770 [Adiantum nelumboides]|nr:hypothetical protein [Adiantum nelumboides]
MKDLRELRYFLQLEVIRMTEVIWLSQRQYALDMLSKYGMADCKPISMPLDVNTKLSAHDGDVLKDLTMYRRILPWNSHLDHALFYAADVPMELHGYTDEDWAGSAIDRRSTSGFMFALGSAAITWRSKKQPTVALSSTEAEYRGAAVIVCEIAWLRKLLMDLRLQVDREIVIYCDNLSSIQLARNPIIHAQTKHIEVHYH